ncbi:MAG: TIM barrel protein [Terracidiphilus sp.]|nr:TIM barrel protein [Terracidiphilus sp.]
MKLGIGTYTYMWSIGFPGAEPEAPMRALDLLRKAVKMGVRVVQFGPNLPLFEMPPVELDEVLSASREMDIELEIGTRGVETAHLRRQIDFTVHCGASLLRTVPEINGRVPSSAELTEPLKAIEPYLRQAGVRLAMENSLMPASAMSEALGTVDSEYLGITLDTVNSLAIPEGTEQVAAALAPWTSCLHVKDFAVLREWHMMGFRVEGRPAGQGQLNVPRLLELLASAGAKCNAIVELWPPPQASPRETIAMEHQWAEESVTYLRRFIKE